MLDSEMTDEYKLIRETTQKFCEKKIRPFVALLDQSPEFQKDIFLQIFKGLADLGFLGLLIPEEYGGTGSDFMSVAIVLEELGRECAGIAFSYMGHTPIVTYSYVFVNGREDQRKKYLGPMCKGEIIGANAITEPDAGNDLQAINTKAKKIGEHFVLNGSKTFITNASVADVFYVLARDIEFDNRMTSFLVDRGTKGLSVGKDMDKCGYRAACTCPVYFEDCLLSEENVLGKRGKGLRAALAEIELQRMYLAYIAVGQARAALQESLKYARTRIQFGKPIGEHQMIQSMLADMATNIEVASAMNHRAMIDYQEGKKKNMERRSILAIMAKKFAASICLKVTLDAMQIHGAYGYTKEYAVERYYREAKFLEIGAGSNEILKILIARDLLRD
jgi:alkylation response protein AidB-like acyl-CoA dehydrogenase